MTDVEAPKRRRVQPTVAGVGKSPERRLRPSVTAGDQIEYGLTYQVTIERQLSVWLKAGVTSSVQPGESTDDAWKRVKEFVDSRMQELIEEHTKGK